MFPFARFFRDRIGRREVDALAETLRRRGVRRVAYLHCEQFAPWRPTLRGKTQEVASAEADAARVRAFERAIAANEHARRLTLFYQPHLAVAPTKGRTNVRVGAPGDPLGFGTANSSAEAIRAAAIGRLADAGYEFQVRLDHRGFTWTPLLADDDLAEKLARPEVRAQDPARFELALRLSLDAIRRETRQPLTTWLFAHPGHALNGCDARACTLAAELDILSRSGCVGDLSFPGPAEGPPFAEPFLIRPIDAVRAWEVPAAEAERAWGNGWAAAEKLLIWSSSVGLAGSSLDLEDADVLPHAERVVGRAPVLGDTLWFKTHASSVRPDGRSAGLTHDRPAARRLLGTVFEAADAAGVEIAHVTAGEAYRAFIAGQGPAGEELALAVPKAVTRRREEGRLARRDMINLLAIDEVMSSVASMGLKESGATEFYQGRAEKGQMIAPYETHLAEMLLDRQPMFGHVYEAGCGAGVFALLMAANGVPATGFDRQDHRVGLASRIRDRVIASGGALPARCEIRKGRVPHVLRRLDGRDAALVFTNVIGSISEADEAALIRLAPRFRMFVVDLARFLRQRDAAGQQALLERFAAAGLPPPLRLAGFPSFRVYLRDRDEI